LFVLSGFSFNPIGLSLTATIYAMQFASLWGIYGLSFWVMLVNLLAAKVGWEGFKPQQVILWVILAAVPYIYGGLHIYYHEQKIQDNATFTAILVQPSFPAEEALKITDRKEYLALIIKEWRQILQITRKQVGEKADLLLLPESVLPYGTYSFVYPHAVVKKAFLETYGQTALKALPPLEYPLANPQDTAQGQIWMVNNAYWVQALANLFDTEVVVGLEDAEDSHEGIREYYSSAMHFSPQTQPGNDFKVGRYEKRVLVPMGEYIPFAFAKGLAEAYGLTGSFTHGKEAKVFNGKIKMGLSICYEETYGHMMRENKHKGAEILLNLTSDIWYPNSRLIYQHFDHARLRTVENGIPLMRACNTGITAGIDSLGRVVGQLGKAGQNIEAISDSLRVKVPLYSYSTLYTYYGDWLIVGLSLMAIGICFYTHRE
jgi:apolipoprotein N-acyltransferase